MQVTQRARRKAMQSIEAEGRKSIDMMLCSALIALYRNWGYRKWRLSRLMQETQNAWNECAADPNTSMLMMLEQETGIELRLEGCQKSYHDLIYLNGTAAGNVNLSPAQWYYMRAEQCKWMGVQVLGSMFLSLHRVFGFGAQRLTTVLGQIDGIKTEFGRDSRKIRKYCEELTGLDLTAYISMRS